MIHIDNTINLRNTIKETQCTDMKIYCVGYGNETIYKECGLPGCDAVKSGGSLRVFQWYILPVQATRVEGVYKTDMSTSV
jgi:hypothetical protein